MSGRRELVTSKNGRLALTLHHGGPDVPAPHFSARAARIGIAVGVGLIVTNGVVYLLTAVRFDWIMAIAATGMIAGAVCLVGWTDYLRRIEDR